MKIISSDRALAQRLFQKIPQWPIELWTIIVAELRHNNLKISPRKIEPLNKFEKRLLTTLSPHPKSFRYSEIAAMMGTKSLTNTAKYCRRLEELGYVEIIEQELVRPDKTTYKAESVRRCQENPNQ